MVIRESLAPPRLCISAKLKKKCCRGGGGGGWSVYNMYPSSRTAEHSALSSRHSYVVFFQHIFRICTLYPENPEGTRVILSSVNMGYDTHPTLPGIELATCSVASPLRFPVALPVQTWRGLTLCLCWWGAVHKVCHAPRGEGSEKVWQFVTGEGEGVKIMWRHTFNFFTIHNFMLYFIFYHA